MTFNCILSSPFILNRDFFDAINHPEIQNNHPVPSYSTSDSTYLYRQLTIKLNAVLVPA